MESENVRLARLEEAMVAVKGDTKYMRGKLDDLLFKVAMIAGGSSALVSVAIVLLSRVVLK